MNNRDTFKRVAAIISASVPLSSWVLVTLAAGSDSDALSSLEDVITLGPRAAGYLHLAWMIADTFGHSLLLGPVALYLWLWLKPRSSNLVTLLLFRGLHTFLSG